MFRFISRWCTTGMDIKWEMIRSWDEVRTVRQKYDNKQYDNKQYDNKQYDNKQYDNKQYDNKQYDNKQTVMLTVVYC